MSILIRLLINAAALYVATRLVPGVVFTGDWPTLLVVALVFGLLNVSVKPLLVSKVARLSPITARARSSSRGAIGLFHSATGQAQPSPKPPLTDRVFAVSGRALIGALSPAPKYCRVARDGAARRALRKASGETAVLVRAVRPWKASSRASKASASGSASRAL